MPKSPFQEKLVQWRQRHRFSLKLAAAILEVPTGTYKNWEYGYTNPSTTCLNCLLKKIEAYRDPQ
jgi:DNA-binding transcriptional regulator YiaG